MSRGVRPDRARLVESPQQPPQRPWEDWRAGEAGNTAPALGYTGASVFAIVLLTSTGREVLLQAFGEWF